jgi:hypothetical protein
MKMQRIKVQKIHNKTIIYIVAAKGIPSKESIFN